MVKVGEEEEQDMLLKPLLNSPELPCYINTLSSIENNLVTNNNNVSGERSTPAVKIDPILKPIINSPRFPEHLKFLMDYMEQEKSRRKSFLEDLTEDGRCEFINGQIELHSPARLGHILVIQNLEMELRDYVKRNDLGMVLSEQALVNFPRNCYMPDLSFWSKEKSRFFSNEMCTFPVPDFIIEVLSDSTQHKDRGIKMSDYAANKVREYWIINEKEKIVEQYILKRNGTYKKLKEIKNSPEAFVECEVLVGLKIELSKIF